MKPPAAPLHPALGPLLFAIALGPVGFASGWWLHPRASVAEASAHATPESARAPVPPDAERGLSGMPTQPTQAGPDGAVAGPSGPGPAQARTRLTAWVEAGCPGGDVQQIMGLLDAWARSEPREALAFVHGAPQFRGRSHAYPILLAHLAGTAPAEMLAWIRRELPGDMRDETLARTLRQLAYTLPEVALRLAASEAPGRPQITTQALEQLAARDPAAACAWFARLDGPAREAGAASLASAWLRRDRAAATAWCLAQQSQPWGQCVMRTLGYHVADAAPEELPAIIAQPGFPPDARLYAIRRVSSANPALALEIASALPREAAGRVVTGMLDTLFLEAPDSAVELGRSVLPPEEFGWRVRAMWARWLGSDRPGALAWAANTADPELRHHLDLEMQSEAVQRDPVAYLAAAAPGSGAPEQARLAQQALCRLAEMETTDLLRWSAIHGTSLTADGASRIGTLLMDTDPAQVLPWLQTLPAGAARDSACAVVVELGAGRKDGTYTQLVGMINDPVLQTKATFRAFQAMFHRDASAAEQWLALQPLEESVRTSWRAIVDDGEEFAPCFGPPG